MLRPATENDLDTVASWIASRRDCALWAGPAFPYPLQRSTLARDIGFSPDTSYGWAEPDLLGFGQLIDKGSGRGHLAMIIIAPQARRTGHGEKLVRALVDLAARRGFSMLGLNVQQDNPGARALYRKLGFEPASRPSRLGPAPGADYMARGLTNGATIQTAGEVGSI